MKKLSKIITLSAAAVALLVASGTTQLNAHASTVSTTKTSVQTSTTSQPTQPFVNGQVNQAFINRFDKAINLTNNKFVINKNLLPKNTTAEELKALNTLVSQSNSALEQAVSNAKTTTTTIVKSGNSVTVSQGAFALEEQTSNKQILGGSRYHNGSNYVHHYWWGFRVGLSKSTLRGAASNAGVLSWLAGGLGLIGKVPTPYTKAATIVGFALQGVNLGLSSAPGGIVFNWSPAPGLPLGVVWGLGWQ